MKFLKNYEKKLLCFVIGQSRIKEAKELGKLPIQTKEFFKNLYENDLMQGNSRFGELDLIHKLFCDE